MGKFFFSHDDKHGDKIILTGDAAHHAINVLRIKIGSMATLCDGAGMDYQGIVEELTPKPPCVVFAVLKVSVNHCEPPAPITLYQGIPKGDKMEWIIEKCIEAGVCKIVPVYTSRSLVKPKDLAKKNERYNRIAASAAGQSMRGIIPIVEKPLSFEQALVADKCALCIIAYENEVKRSIKATIKNIKPCPLSIWVGPEGGFAPSEVAKLEETLQAQPISLGPRILRTETAGLVAIAQITCIWEME